VHYHHTGVKPRWQWRLIYALARSRFHIITFTSDFVRREAEEIYPPIAAISKTIRTPLRLPPLPSLCEKFAARQRLGIAPDVPVIGNAAWLIPRKRFDIFLRVAARLAASRPQALFVVAGDGPNRTHLERLARELGVAQQVKWIGWQTDLKDFYCALDVLLFNSDWDAMGRTPIEAIGYGVPVVASIVHGGLQEVLEPGTHVFLCSQHDVECLAEKLLSVLAHPEEAREMTNIGRRHLLEINPFEQLVTTIEGDLGRRG
jgi:glycosyltransferase involved in cell wall biosynthesis